jgi:DNA-binding response OmpR family regulator
MKVLLVEDNKAFGDEIYQSLKRTFREVVWLETESDFRAAFDELAYNPPEVAIIDVMLRWDTPRREGMRPRPPDVPNTHSAGFRCVQLLERDERTQAVPVVLYSVLDHADVADEMHGIRGKVSFLQKTSSPEELIALIQRVTGQSG